MVQAIYKIWVQTVLLPCILVTSRDQSVSIVFVNNTYIGNIRKFCHRKLYTKTWYSSKSLWILTFFIFLPDFFSPKCVNTTRLKYFPRAKMS